MRTDRHPLERRRLATEATIAHFAGKVHGWGGFDCAKMGAFHARKAGVSVGIAKAGPYSTALGARRALGRLGVENLEQLLDRHFARIAPAAALIGDYLLLPSGDAFGALTIACGNSAVLGWHEAEAACCIMRVRFVDTIAWRLV